MIAEEILSVREVGHSFGGVTVLTNVTFAVPNGKIVGLIGPNGSGKTTLFNIISGFLRPRRGDVLYAGHNQCKNSIQQRSNAGLIRTFQTPKVFEQMTVMENIMVGACKLTSSGMLEDLLQLSRSRHDMRKIREKADAICEKFQLTHLSHLRAHTLSAGQRRILELARAVISRPSLLLLDEPSSGLDTEEIYHLRAWIEQLNTEGISILLVSHDMELMSVADQVHVLYVGEIIVSGSMSEIQRNHQVRDVYLGI